MRGLPVFLGSWLLPFVLLLRRVVPHIPALREPCSQFLILGALLLAGIACTSEDQLDVGQVEALQGRVDTLDQSMERSEADVATLRDQVALAQESLAALQKDIGALTKALGLSQLVLYYEDFNDGHGGWSTLTSAGSRDVSRLALWGGGHIVASSPWASDPRHTGPRGIGLVEVIYFVYLRDAFRLQTVDSLDLTDATIQFRMMAEDLNAPGGHLYFWFQTPIPGTEKHANFALTAYRIDRLLIDRQWVDVTLRTSVEDWTCMGAAEDTLDRYGCMPTKEALRDVRTDFGFITISPGPGSEGKTIGTIKLDELLITK